MQLGDRPLATGAKGKSDTATYIFSAGRFATIEKEAGRVSMEEPDIAAAALLYGRENCS
jgi:hypothetical protein